MTMQSAAEHRPADSSHSLVDGRLLHVSVLSGRDRDRTPILAWYRATASREEFRIRAQDAGIERVRGTPYASIIDRQAPAHRSGVLAALNMVADSPPPEFGSLSVPSGCRRAGTALNTDHSRGRATTQGADGSSAPSTSTPSQQ
jgi:hypothetical protein